MILFQVIPLSLVYILDKSLITLYLTNLIPSTTLLHSSCILLRATVPNHSALASSPNTINTPSRADAQLQLPLLIQLIHQLVLTPQAYLVAAVHCALPGPIAALQLLITLPFLLLRLIYQLVLTLQACLVATVHYALPGPMAALQLLVTLLVILVLTL